MVNSSSKNYIAYCFADVSGYSKMGKYIGNSNANGTFVYTGFKPTCIIIKRINSSADWYIYDTTRSIYNSTANILYPSLNNVDYTGTGNTIDILSNGFKMRSTNGDSNGGTHIFYAVGQTIVGTNSVPATAR